MSQESLLPFMAIFIATAITFLLVWFFANSLRGRRRRELDRRINGHSDSEMTLTLTEALPGQPPKGFFQRLDAGFDDMIARTGLELDGGLALAIIVLCGMIPAGIMFVWRAEEEPWLAAPAFLIGALVPLAIFMWRQGVWRRTMQNQLPDVFFLLARSLRAGRSIDQAMQLVGSHGVPPLSKEFARMHRQMDLGLPLGQVLENGAKRLQLVDFNVFASVVGLHRATGGNLPVILDRLASATRDHNQFEGQYRAVTVLGRYSAAFIASLAMIILFFFFMFYRDITMKFFESGWGIFLFSIGVTLEICGILLLFFFLRHDYH
jgi:tight adherence protein B